MTVDQIRSLQPALAALLQRFRRCFKTVNSFNHWQRYLTGLLTDFKRKSIEPIALGAGVPVRTLQEFLAFLVWDERRINDTLQRMVADEHASNQAIGVIDASSHPKQGHKTPGVQRQWCGQSGKVDNCVVGQHLLYTNNDLQNPFSCVLASDLYLPRSWDDDRERCRGAHIPEEVVYRPKWKIALDQLGEAMGNGVRFSWVTFDEDYGKVPEFWFALNALGQRGIGEVPRNFLCWPTHPSCRSLQGPHASKRVDNVCRHSPVFRSREWRRLTIKQTTRGPAVWKIKAARVHLVDTTGSVSVPTDRRYWLIVAENSKTDEVKYFVSNAPASATIQEMMAAAFARWHIEKWFERAKQEAGFGAFEVRTYKSLIRHWLSSRMAMYFLAEQTQRLRGEKSADHPGAGRGCGERADRQSVDARLACVG